MFVVNENEARCLFIKDQNELVYVEAKMGKKDPKSMLKQKVEAKKFQAWKEFDNCVLHWPFIAYSLRRKSLEVHSVDQPGNFYSIEFENDVERIALVSRGFK